MSDAADLATLFFDWSKTVDDYRENHAATLTPDQEIGLKSFAKQLDNAATHFTLEEVDETIASAEGAVDQIKTVTAKAKQALERLQTIEKVTQVLAAAATMGKCAASGNLAGLLGAIGDLTKAIAPPGAGSAKA